PLEVVEDSRCPESVVCVWQGTVKVRTRIVSAWGERALVFELGKPLDTALERITLTGVLPEKTAPGLPQGGYRFTFTVEKSAGMEI
ncbi:hypothetical protein KW797_04225, partial [Candidatus Parcubacteria bacterium]|nr:hypothetical protein [Candidatus Parcubacteria bacterium]